MTVTKRARVAWAFVAVWLVWGSTYLAIAWAVETIPPLLMVGARSLVAGGALYGWARLSGGPRPRPADWRAAAVAGFLLFVTGQAGLAWAETRIPSGAASLLIATEPLFVAVIAWRGGWLTGSAGRPIGAGNVLALLAGLAGVGLLVVPRSGPESLDPIGAAVVVLTALSWSIGVFRAGSRPGMAAGQTAGMQLLAAGAALLLISGSAGELSSFSIEDVSTRSLAALGYLVVFGSIVTFGAYVWLLDRVHPSLVSTHAYVNPLVAVFLGSLLNSEPVTATLVAAAALILGSVAMLLAPAATGSTGPTRRVGAPHRTARSALPSSRASASRLPSRPSADGPSEAALL